MAHLDDETLPLSQDSLMEPDEGEFSSDEGSLLNDSSDEDYYPSDRSTSDADTSDLEQELEMPQVISENCQLDSDEDSAPPKKKQRICNTPKKKQRICNSPKKKQSWKTERDTDITLPPLRFLPRREPGVQLRVSDNYSPLDIFKLFFSEKTVAILCRNTNKLAARNQANGAKYKWTDVKVPEFYKYIGLLYYMSLVRLNSIRDYWRRDNIFSVPFPREVMMRDRYRTISWNVHMSDPDEDRENDAKKGTPLYDRLFRAKPLMHTIQEACKTYYHPRRNLAIDERMVACRSHTGMTQYMKDKPTKWGLKLFVLADSSNGYTVDFSFFTGKNQVKSGKGIPYDAVMSLINKNYLGSGYHIYMDNFYTSEKLFKDLYRLKFGACGTYRDSQGKVLELKSERGSFRWRRDGPLLFVKWMDAREVNICSTIHTAYKGNTIARKVKDHNGIWTSKHYPCPEPVLEYNKHMGGVDLSDQLIQYYSTQHKVLKWYRKLFFHFLDIASTNAYLIYKEHQQQQKKQEKLSHRMFMEELTAQLCGLTSSKMIPKGLQKAVISNHGDHHLPISVARERETDLRKHCVYCLKHKNKRTKASWKCKICEIHLCLTVNRNCFEAWHMMDHTSCCINNSHKCDKNKIAKVKAQIYTESLKGEDDHVEAESLMNSQDQVETESLKTEGQFETKSLKGEEDQVETKSLKSEDQIKTKSLNGEDQVETKSLNGEDQVEVESLNGEEDQVKTESLKGKEDQVETKSLNGGDQVETKSMSVEDQVEVKSLNDEEDQVQTESLKGKEDQVETKSLNGGDQVETKSMSVEDQVEVKSLNGEDQVSTKSLNAEEDQVETKSLDCEDQVEIKSLNGTEDQVETRSSNSQDEVKVESLNSEEDQVKAESLNAQDQDHWILKATEPDSTPNLCGSEDRFR